MALKAKIGLEVHAQLLTDSKMFCACSTRFGETANSQCCPVCSGVPGTLPVPNKLAIELVIKTGLALGCGIAEHCRFARKNYFYPDMPKNYQISQYDEPLTFDGMIEVDVLIENLVPGQRYRLLLPVPSYPRPGIYPIPGFEELRVREHEGVVATLPVHGHFAVAGERCALHVSGAGLREVECYSRKNDWLFAITLCRVPEGDDAPRRLRRRFRILVLDVGELDSVID